MNVKKGKYIAVLVLWVCVSNNGYAKVYKWVDENGKTHYSDKPFKQAKDNSVKELKLKEKDLKVDSANSQRMKSCENSVNLQQCLRDKMLAEESIRNKNINEKNKIFFDELEKKQRQRTNSDESSNPQFADKKKPLTKCQQARKLHTELTHSSWEGGVHKFTALEEDGKIASQERKDEVIKELSELLNSRECKYEES
ncbi:DUF4124 domain-containing protein [Aliikangiella sp. IMCC44359]|uniref:DUF4124 domain-containing protein n=1 Tax=Aliikangiella sp. IMCC44359 TaxID=3459125 RepID=UPI00403A8B4F